MEKIIPFKKEIMFRNTIEEILSISMDNHLEISESEVKGNFIISGEYQYSNEKEPFNFDIPYLGYIDDNYDTKDAKVDIDDFYYEINEPNKLSIFIGISVDNLSEKPLIEHEFIEEEKQEEIIEIEEILEEEREEINEMEEFLEDEREDVIETREVLEDKKEEIIEMKEILEDEREEMIKMEEILEEKREEMIETEEVLEEKREEVPEVIFKSFNDKDESYMTYKVYIVREGDTIESIMERYEISNEELVKYNVINELSIGDKLIIPNEKN